MPHDKQLPPPVQPAPMLECVLRAVFLEQDALIPLTVAEVAAYDARADKIAPVPMPPRSPSMLFSWERKDRPKKAVVVPFPAPVGTGPLAYAARGKMSPASQARLSQLIVDMDRGAACANG